VAGKNKAIDEVDRRGLSDRLRRVRRKPGSDKLSSQGDSTVMTRARRSGHVRSQTRGGTLVAAGNNGATTMLQSIEHNDTEHMERRKRNLEEMRALWEVTLPKPVKVCLGHHSPERA
jgi:serine/threonine-protein phosphatase PP1 catalytic subunit